jgi:hypothetical protein
MPGTYPRIVRAQVLLDRKLIKDPTWVMYLVIPEKLQVGIKVLAPKAINTLINRYLGPYMEKGTRPPEQIAGAIMNVADDVMVGRQPTLRAGDYIALQTFAKG